MSVRITAWRSKRQAETMIKETENGERKMQRNKATNEERKKKRRRRKETMRNEE